MQERQKKRKQNILLLVIVGVALAVAAYFQFFLSEQADEVSAEITELVEKYNKSCPLNIQEGIRLDSVNLPKERAVQYNLTLMNVVNETAEINVIQEEIKKSLLSTAKANPGLQVFRENDYTLVYSYSDKKKVFLFEVKILPDEYK
jgi:flagellar basal body-associated protein FliL